MTAINFGEMWREEKRKASNKKKQAKAPCYDLPGQPEVLEDYKIGEEKSLSTVFYIPEWLSERDEANLCENIYKSNDTWKQLSQRRLKMWGGVPSHDGMMSTPLPYWIQPITDSIHKNRLTENPLNHILLNEYTHGKGIAAHYDGPLYESSVAVINLLGPALLEFIHPKSGDIIASVLLEPRSLLLFKDEAYNALKHRIQSRACDTIDSNVINIALCHKHIGDQILRDDVRLSLTLRTVKKLARNECVASVVEKEEMCRREQFFYRSISEQ